VSPKGGTLEGLLARIPAPRFGGAKQGDSSRNRTHTYLSNYCPCTEWGTNHTIHTKGTRSLLTSDTASTTITSFPLGVLLVCLFDFCIGSTVI